MTDPSPLVGLIAKRFITRRDVFAEQMPQGGYRPVLEYKDGPRVPIKGRHLQQHLDGQKTYGHYLLGEDNTCKFFAFDIDLEKNGDPEKEEDPFEGSWVQTPDLETWTGSEDEWWKAKVVHPCNPREDWKDRRFPGRTWLKYQMKMVASMLARTIKEELDIPVAVAYTGAKGLHVYGFTGSVPATHVRDGAQVVLDALGCFTPHRGHHFFKHANQDPVDGYPNLSIEVFPKQTDLSEKAEGLGNLMRLPLGRNLKNPKDPTFFVDMRGPMNTLAPHSDVVGLLESGDPWRD